MPSSLITTTFLSLLIFQTVNGQCVDNEERFQFLNKNGILISKKCSWAQRKKTSKRCTKKEAVASNCPNTCDPDCLKPPLSATGCRDSLYRFQLISGRKKFKLCTWAAAKETAMRCSKFPTKLYCPLTCDTCGSEPSASPSLSQQPTKAPTKEPSSKPSLTNVPTKANSFVPSSTPTFICNDVADKVYVNDPVGQYKPCDPWVKNNPGYRCGLVTGIGGTGVGVVSDFCPLSCGSCPNSPSANPSLSSPPSRKPSDEPSLGPSLSSEEPSISPTNFPSDEPSLVPSDEPSEEPSQFPSNEPSILPSDEPSILPSGMPSECNNSPWTIEVTLSNGGTTTYNCDNIGNFCVTPGAGTELYNDKTASQACCVCGGSLEHSVSPSSFPSDEPSQSPSGCVNYPKNAPDSWTTNDGSYTCASFSPGTNCAIVETLGTGDKTASDACCNCGGGDHIATAGS